MLTRALTHTHSTCTNTPILPPTHITWKSTEDCTQRACPWDVLYCTATWGYNLYSHVPTKIAPHPPPPHHQLKCARCGLVLLTLIACWGPHKKLILCLLTWRSSGETNMQFRERNQCREVEKPVRKWINWSVCSLSAFDERAEIIQIHWLDWIRGWTISQSVMALWLSYSWIYRRCFAGRLKHKLYKNACFDNWQTTSGNEECPVLGWNFLEGEISESPCVYAAWSACAPYWTFCHFTCCSLSIFPRSLLLHQRSLLNS